jgi:hypothetical protein
VLRFGFSLLAAALLTFAGYSALGHAAAPSAPQLRVIATVTVHAHHRAAFSAAATPQTLPLL